MRKTLINALTRTIHEVVNIWIRTYIKLRYETYVINVVSIEALQDNFHLVKILVDKKISCEILIIFIYIYI